MLVPRTLNYFFAMNPNDTLPTPDESEAMEKILIALQASQEAEYLTGPHGMASGTLAMLAGTNESAISESLQDAAKVLHDGSLEGVEAKLLSQAAVLDCLFHSITQHAYKEPQSVANFNDYLKVALRAQAQSARALEILANIKQGPRVVFAGQVNAANQQIVNNGTSAPNGSETRIVRSAKNKNLSPARARGKRLKAPTLNRFSDYEMDTRSKRKTAADNPGLEAVDAIHRPPQRRRKAKEQPEC